MLPSLQRLLEIAGTILTIFVLLFIGLLSGIAFWTVTVNLFFPPFQADFFQGVLTIAAFTLFLSITGTFITWQVWTGHRRTPLATDSHPIQAIIPAYTDANVLTISVESLLKSTYDPLTITIVVEPDDTETRQKAEELATTHDQVECVINGYPGSKATAINYVIEHSDVDHFAIFDADEWISPKFISGVMGELLNGADVVQGRRIPRPTGAVETIAYCERLLVESGYAFSEILGFTQCQSSSTAFTRKTFDTVGGYEDKLTEDLDFSHNCYQANLTVVNNRSLANTMEAPHTIRDLWGQRKRWRIGHIQVFDSNLREAFRGRIDVSDILSITRAMGSILTGAFLIILVTHIVLMLLLGNNAIFFIPYAGLLTIVGSIWLRDSLDGYIGYPSWTILLIPLLILGHGVLTIKAFLEYYLTWNGEWYQVSKDGNNKN